MAWYDGIVGNAANTMASALPLHQLANLPGTQYDSSPFAQQSSFAPQTPNFLTSAPGPFLGYISPFSLGGLFSAGLNSIPFMPSLKDLPFVPLPTTSAQWNAAQASHGGQPQPQPQAPERPSPVAPVSTNAEMPAAGDVNGWRNVIMSQVPQQYRNNAALINTILAGGMAESGLNPTRMQQGGNGVGFWQFDTGGGMGTGVPLNQLQSEAYQASRIIPQYIQAWNSAPAGLSPAALASWVAAQAERPYDYQNPLSTARQNYANAYNQITGGR